MLLADAFIENFGPTGQWSIHLLFEIVISVLAVFLILLVLVQRGRGGGLAGALGGMGGQSAFGTRAGDTFTWITYTVAAIWIILAAITIKTFTDPVADRAAAQAEQAEEVPTDSAQALPVGESDAATDSAEPADKTSDEAEKADDAAPKSEADAPKDKSETELKSDEAAPKSEATEPATKDEPSEKATPENQDAPAEKADADESK